MRIVVFAVAMFLIVLARPVPANGQTDLDKLDEKFARHFEKVMPGWKHDRVESITGSKDVLIQYWSRSNRKVKISIIVHKSADEAREVLERHAKHESNKERLSDIGEEAYAGGYGSSVVAFRKGRFTVYVSTTANIGETDEERMLNQVERFELMKSEMRRLSREFAKHAAKIDHP